MNALTKQRGEPFSRDHCQERLIICYSMIFILKVNRARILLSAPKSVLLPEYALPTADKTFKKMPNFNPMCLQYLSIST